MQIINTPFYPPSIATRKPYDISLSTSCSFILFFLSPLCPVVAVPICMGYTLGCKQPTNGQLQKHSYSPNSSLFTILLAFPSISLPRREIIFFAFFYCSLDFKVHLSLLTFQPCKLICYIVGIVRHKIAMLFILSKSKINNVPQQGSDSGMQL